MGNSPRMLARWTTDDFDQLSWHDCAVHGFRFTRVTEDDPTCDLELDIDFIVEWLCRIDRSIDFRIAPATLTFHEVTELQMSLDYRQPLAAMTPFSLAGIARARRDYPNGYFSFRWKLDINWPSGRIEFEAPRFTQILRCEPLLLPRQMMFSSERDRST